MSVFGVPTSAMCFPNRLGRTSGGVATTPPLVVPAARCLLVLPTLSEEVISTLARPPVKKLFHDWTDVFLGISLENRR